jgi:hypothetical protein
MIGGSTMCKFLVTVCAFGYFNEPDDPFKSGGYGPLCKITTGG